MVKNDTTQSETYRFADPIYDIVSQVVNEIRVNHNYDAGAKIAIDNKITLQQMITKTYKLNVFDIAKLADAMKKIKK